MSISSSPPLSRAHLSRYVVRSSDVLSDMRVNVSEEGSDKVIWYKERFLTDDEIVEHIVENTSSTVLWTIHRPNRGWYIRLRTPSFPPGVFISLAPTPASSPYHAEAALTFACRTNAIPASPPLPKRSFDSASVHSYPPTPPQNPTVVVLPPSPRSVNARLSEVPPRAPAQTITHFVLAPHTHTHTPHRTLLARVASALRDSAPVHSYSFSLSPVPPAPAPAPGASSTDSLTGVAPLVPILTFHDQTSSWIAASITGTLEIDNGLERVLGVDTGFYIAVALTYLEFLSERESYLAALAD